MRDGPDVKIDRVLVSSYKSPITVTGVPPGVPVEKSWYQYLGDDGHQLERARTDNAFEFFTMGASLVPGASDLDNQSDFQHMKKVVEAHLHQPIKTFQGAYRESRFTVR
jgi:hypothetical protein